MGSPNVLSDVPSASLEMERLCNPKHWGGLVLACDPDLAFSGPKADKASAKFALRTLEAVLAPGMRGETLETYLPGTIFVPEDHEPGTAVIYHQEMLLRQGLDIPLEAMEKYTRRAAPKRPTELERALANTAVVSFMARHREGHGAAYREEVRYGVVPPDYGHDHRRLITISAHSVNHLTHKRSASELSSGKVGGVAIDGDLVCPKVERDPIPIGATRHFKRPRPKKRHFDGSRSRSPIDPRLVKINRLEVLAFG